MEFIIDILCKYTIQEIYKIMLTFKQEVGLHKFDNDLEFSATNKNFRIWVREEPDEFENDISYLNGIFIANLGITPIIKKTKMID